MKPYTDLTGMRSGKLVAIRPTEKRARGSVIWECRCDCGKTAYVESYKIKKGLTKSCGCSRIGKRTTDLEGQRFGYLTAIRRTSIKRQSTYMWECKCDCGKTVLVSAGMLKGGNTTSCGCKKQKNIRKILEQGTIIDHAHFVEGTCLEKLKTKKTYRNNTSGVRGVRSFRGRWMATIGFQGKNIYLGVYDKLEDAVKARKIAEEKYYKPMLEKYENA